MLRVRAIALFAALCVPAPLRAEQLTQSVDAVSFFDEEERTLVSVLPMVGYEERTGAFPALSVAVGHLFASHFLLEGVTTARLLPPLHVSLGVRTGAFFSGSVGTIGFSVTPMVLTVPETREIGVGATWELAATVNVAPGNSLKIEGAVDLLFDELGFDRDRPIAYGGVGWMWSF